MAKINHNRPLLKYLDNFRRELAREGRSAPTWFKSENVAALGLKIKRDEEFSEHILSFLKLPLEQQKIANGAFVAYGVYLDSLSSVIYLIMNGDSKKRERARLKREQAEESFVVAGAVLVTTIFDDFKAGRSGFLDWFQSFYADLNTESRMAWAEFGEKLFHDCTALFVAQQLADDPEGVQEIRALMMLNDDG